MLNLDVINSEVQINILNQLSTKDMNNVLLTNKNLYTQKSALLPYLQNEIERRVNAFVNALFETLEKNKLFEEITLIKNIHPSLWKSEIDIYFTDDFKFTFNRHNKTLHNIKFQVDNWIFNKFLIKLPSSSGELNDHIQRLYHQIIHKKRMESFDDPMQIDQPTTSSDTYDGVVGPLAPFKINSMPDFTKTLCLWISASPEEKNRYFYMILNAMKSHNMPFSVFVKSLLAATLFLKQEAHFSTHMASFFKSLFVYKQSETIHAHLPEQHIDVISKFFMECIEKYPQEVKILVKNFPTDNEKQKKLKKIGYLFILRSYILKREDANALELAQDNMYYSLCRHIFALFNDSNRSQVERFIFVCKLFLRYPEITKKTKCLLIAKKCVSFFIEEYGMEATLQMIPESLKPLLLKIPNYEIKKLQHSYELKRQALNNSMFYKPPE